MKSIKNHLPFFGIVLAGLLLRLLFIANTFIDSDQAMVGLMGVEMLKGYFTPFWWGQNYMGTIESILSAGFFHILGIGIYQLFLAPLSFWILFMVFSYKFMLSAAGKLAAITVSLLLALSSPSFLQWTIVPRGGYVGTLLFGSILFFLLLKLESGNKHPYWISALFGIVAGIAFWTHMIIVFYLLPAAFLILLVSYKSKRLKNIPVILISFIIGSFPFWYYNINSTDTSTMGMLRFFDIHRYWYKAFYMLTNYEVPILLGFKTLYKPYYHVALLPLELTKPLVSGAPLSKIVALLLEPFALLTSLSLLFVMMAGFLGILFTWIPWKKSTRFPLSLKGIALIIPINLFFVISTQYGAFNTQRFIIPIYWVLAIGAGIIFTNLARTRYCWIGLILLSFVVLHNVFTNLDYYNRVHRPRAIQFNTKMKGLVNALNELKINRIYADFWDAYVVTFYSGTEIIADTWSKKRYWRYQKEVETLEESPALVFGGAPERLRDYFMANNVKWKEKIIPFYSIFYDFKTPPQGNSLSGNQFIIKELEMTPEDLGISNDSIVPDTKPVARRYFLIQNFSQIPIATILVEGAGKNALHFAAFSKGFDGKWIRTASVPNNLLGFFFYKNRLFYERDYRFSTAWGSADSKKILIVIEYEKDSPKPDLPKITLFKKQ